MKYQKGIGIEVEFQIVCKESEVPQSKIQGQPSILYIQNQISENYSHLIKNVTSEQVSIILEIASDVQLSLLQCYFQVLDIYRLINEEILDHFDLKLLASPVTSAPFEVIPASLDKESRSYQLFHKWGIDKMEQTATCSFQVNDSYIMPIFISADDQFIHLKKFINTYHSNIEKYINLNTERSYFNQTRLQIAHDLLWSIKSESFKYYGLNENDLFLPPSGLDDITLIEWMLAHNQIRKSSSFIQRTSLEDMLKLIDPKSVHGFLKFKYNRDNLFDTWILEHRFIDSTLDILKIQNFHEIFHNDLYASSMSMK